MIACSGISWLRSHSGAREAPSQCRGGRCSSGGDTWVLSLLSGRLRPHTALVAQPQHALSSRLGLRQCYAVSQLADSFTAAAEAAGVEAAGAAACQASELPPPAQCSPGICVRQAKSAAELESCASMRAEAYYEEGMKCSRFTQSFVKQYARQEYAALRQRIIAPAGAQPEAVCLVAVQNSGMLLGTLDFRPPACTASRQPKGVPEGDDHGAYVLNLVVVSLWRGTGVGHALMAAASKLAAEHWAAERIYVHLDSQNVVASKLYRRCGYTVFDDLGCEPGLGRRLLLVKELRNLEDMDQAQV